MIIIGNLGEDAVLQNPNTDREFITFDIAETYNYTDPTGVRASTTTWYSVSMSSKRKNVLPYLKKGTHLYVEGRATIRQFQKKDGTVGCAIDIRAENIEF